MADASLDYGCNTADMKMIHGVFRREFQLAPPMVRAVEIGDMAKAGRVRAHVVEIAEMLHHHHHGEEVLVFDKLEVRAPACAIHVGIMRQEEEQILPVAETSMTEKEWDAVGEAGIASLSKSRLLV
ncbi:MAG: hemerythrin protein [Aeromicrobium sp.]|nr:hemerythrin protein [Aeromicrobium sp.]